jgi:hypothetical protein
MYSEDAIQAAPLVYKESRDIQINDSNALFCNS